MERLRIGLIGCGGIAHQHTSEYYRNNPAEVELIACADVESARRDGFRDTYQISRAYAEPVELLANRDIDVVDICTPPATHPALIRAAAEAGKHVICEKPVGLDYAEAAAAMAVADRAGVKVGVMQNYRFRPEHIEARNALNGGLLGKPLMASVQALFHWNGGVPYRLAAKKMLMIEVGYHYVDLLRFLLGSDVTRVYAAAGRPKNSEAVGETYSTLVLHFANGAIGSIVNSGECQGITANWGGEVVVQAEHGTVYANYPRPFTFTMYSGRAGGLYEQVFPREQFSIWTHVPYSKPLSAYYRALGDGHEFPVSGKDNLNTLAAVLAAYESVESDQVVDVADFVERQSAYPKR